MIFRKVILHLHTLNQAVKLQAKTIGRLAVQSSGAIIKMEHMIGRQGSVGSEQKLSL